MKGKKRSTMQSGDMEDGRSGGSGGLRGNEAAGNKIKRCPHIKVMKEPYLKNVDGLIFQRK